MKPRQVTYDCCLCRSPHTAPKDEALALLKLCRDCGAKRFQAGKREQRKALAAERGMA